MFLRFGSLGRRSFSDALLFCLLIGRMFAGWACSCAFGCLEGAPLAFPYLYACLLAAHLPVVHVFALLVAR